MTLEIVAVLTIDDAAIVTELGDTLAQNGVTVAEVTMRTPQSMSALQGLKRAGLRVAAGTVLTASQVDQAVDAGAEWIVSPGLDDNVVHAAQARGVTAIPGIASATECQRALRLGIDKVKVFPVDLLGGPQLISALSGPFGGIQFMPSGGVDAHTVGPLAAHPAVFAVSSGWIVERGLLRDAAFSEVGRRCRELALAARGASK